ncbi:glycosyltransferase [Agromyces sp. CFH 90414]|uniref:Glycosyltransferase n=1 Tax=Agromyces agglutinans TaxID=2662258 RepID=A0A6I2F8K7_9MICO|nr:glycosyltransferase [Agromyces agglutinans]MRG60584.1 glycosyltransferase [Agromyces agglutinans]
MFPRVTAILVVHRGGDRLRRTLAAIDAQQQAPDELIVVLDDADASADELIPESASHVVRLSTRASFGEAVRAADRVLEAPADERAALWLLAEDSAPAPDALATLVATLETERSVAVAGPKLMRWDAPDRIAHLGRSITRFGRTIDLVADELDQGQHDEVSDVLGLDPAGLLVRHAVWRSLGGFDPGLPVADDALDFSLRARLAGHRVSVVPAARVDVAETGVAGQAVGRGRTARRARRIARSAELHRRLVYAPALVMPLHWLSLLPLALVRSIGLLLLKAPGAIAGEFAAALGAMFAFGRVARARGTLRRGKTVGWSAIAPLRVPPDEVRRRRRAAAEARRARARGRSEDLQFLGTGGGWVLLGSLVASVVLLPWLLAAAGVAGGALAPLSSDLGELWANAAYGWRDVGAGFVGAADPFAGILAVLGSITFWSPSYAMVLLWLIAVPAAALGAWFAASRLTERGAVRTFAAIAWVAAPPFLVAIGDGRPGAVLAHALLGWLVFAALGAATSWASAATASLLFAAVVAAAPSLTPALLLGWVVAMAVSGRAAIRYLLVPLPALALAAPLIWDQVQRGTPLGLLADAGLPVPSAVPAPGWLALGFPGGSDGAWGVVVSWLGFPWEPIWPAIGLVAPLVLLAAASVAAGRRRLRAALLALAAAAAGFATAVAAAHVSVATTGADAVAIWTGAGQSLAWFGLVIAAVVALDAMRRGAAGVGAIAWIAAVVLVLPLAASLVSGRVPVGPAAERELPAVVVAEADDDPRVATLRLAPLEDGSLRAWLEHGAGTTLDDASTLDATRRGLTDDEERLAELAGNLASRSGFDAEAAVTEFGTTFVLLAPGDESDGRRAAATAERARAALDGNAALTPVAETAFGTLWRFRDAPSPAPAAAIPADAGGSATVVWTVVQLVVLGAALLLSIPAGVGREADRRAVREPRTRRPRRPRRRTVVEVPPGAADAPTEPDAPVEEPLEPDGPAEEPDAPAEPDGPAEELDAPAEPDASDRSDPSEPEAPEAPKGDDRG